MAATTKSAAAAIAKKKRWVTVLAPQAFGASPIGETYVEEPAQAIGRSVSVSMMVLTGDPAKQAIHLRFKITGIEKDQFQTAPVSYEIAFPALKKLMRRGRKKVFDSFICKTKDDVLVRLKPVVITRHATTGAILAALKRHIRGMYPRYAATRTFDELMSDIIEHKIQQAVFTTLRKVYPLQACELRWAGLCIEEKAVPIPVVDGVMPGDSIKPAKKAEQKAEEQGEQAETQAETPVPEPGESDAAMGA